MTALVLASAVAAAQNEMVAVPNRPTVSTTAQPVQAGVLETEWGVDAASSHQDVNDLFKFGLTSNFELRLGNARFGGHGRRIQVPSYSRFRAPALGRAYVHVDGGDGNQHARIGRAESFLCRPRQQRSGEASFRLQFDRELA
jgi:hypothetical protein